MSKVAKVCGIKTEEDALKVIESGSDLMGIILVPNRKRTVDLDVARKISNMVRHRREVKNRRYKTMDEIFEFISSKEYNHIDDYLLHVSDVIRENGPFLVGVFRNQSFDDVFKIATELKLDFVQLHGDEDSLKFCDLNLEKGKPRFGVIPRFVVPNDVDKMYDVLDRIIKDKRWVGKGFVLPLLDAEAGGEGRTIDWAAVERLDRGKYILAGGLSPDNILKAKLIEKAIAYDVSSGVENKEGTKDHQKIELYIKSIKS